MAVTPRQLLRLFPGLWRVRYGDEFLALLEKTLLTRAVVIDVIRAAVREWIVHTRIGRLLLGCVVAEAATIIGLGMVRLVPPASVFGDHKMHSLSGVALLGISGFAPVVVGALLIVLRTRHDRAFAWLGLPYQLAALFLAATWAQWVGLGWQIADDAVVVLTWKSAIGAALEVTWMLLLLLNVDRSREAYYPWRRLAARVSSDRY